MKIELWFLEYFLFLWFSGLAYGDSGTLWYVAEEVKNDEGHGIPSDLFSIAVTAFEMFCGERPFEEDDELCDDGIVRDVCIIRVCG